MRVFKDNDSLRPHMSMTNAPVANAHLIHKPLPKAPTLTDLTPAHDSACPMATLSSDTQTLASDTQFLPLNNKGAISLVRQSISSTLDQWIEYLCQPAFRHHHIELWVFNDRQTRRRAEAKLFEHGIHARIRSAYKPFLHFLLEDLSPAEFERVNHPDSRLVLQYPNDTFGSDKRFALETYPFANLCHRATIEFTPRRDQQLSYQLTVTSPHAEPVSYEIFAPNVVKTNVTGQANLSPTGWITISDAKHHPILDERVYCDYEQLFESALHQICDALREHPHFERLMIEVQAPLPDEPLNIDHEHISLREGLHEDFYFTLQEWCKHQQDKDAHDRSAQFGQIVPNITYQAGDYHCHCYLTEYYRDEPDACLIKANGRHQHPADAAESPLSNATQMLSSAQVAQALEGIKGQPLLAQSVSGLSVKAKYCQGTDQPVLISAGQHANEATGIVGALHAAQLLSQQAGHHFVISPLENPDGYALYQHLLQANPTHMHHAARYTALGNDLEFHNTHQPYEKAIREQALQLSRAKLHINLHGYPAHEWVRPLSGYIPTGFADWTIPKGFFVILRYQAKHCHLALAFIEYLTQTLAQNQALLAFNNKQLNAFQRHGGQSDFIFINRIPCLLQKVSNEALTPLQLITEFPDESITGEAFCFGHQVQSDVVIKAYQAFQHCMAQPSFSALLTSHPDLSL